MDAVGAVPVVKSYSPYQFAFFRIVLGIYLAIHFATLIPYGAELYSAAGMIADPSLNPTYRIFPNILNVVSSPAGVDAILAVLGVLSLLYAVGFRRRIAAVLLWYGWASVFNRNLLTSNPSLPFVGWLLLASALIPEGEPLSIDRKRHSSSNWELPRALYWGAWIILAIGYTVSGIHKLTAPSWSDGTALIHVLNIPLARDNLIRETMLFLPVPLLRLMTWGAVAVETFFLPMCLLRTTRMPAWIAATAMQIGILAVVNFTDLTMGMLMIHLFTFDSRWLPSSVAGRQPLVVFFDGVCGLCDRSVVWLMGEDRERHLRFAPLQGMTSREVLGPSTTYTSIIVKDGSRVYERSDAVIRILTAIGGIWRLAEVLRVIPVPARNAVYDYVARHRYQWFGKMESCRMPTPEEAERMLP